MKSFIFYVVERLDFLMVLNWNNCGFEQISVNKLNLLQDSVRMRENTDQKNSEYWQWLYFWHFNQTWFCCFSTLA